MSTARGHQQRARRGRHRQHRPATLPHFLQLAPAIMQDLMDAFDLTPVQAAAIVGNLGTESQDFTAHHEKGTPENQGGYGWAQWTANRRTTFFAWADSHGLDRNSEAASLGYLEHELRTTYRVCIVLLKSKTELRAATYSFMKSYENPGIPHESSRQEHARLALQQYLLAKGLQSTLDLASAATGMTVPNLLKRP